MRHVLRVALLAAVMTAPATAGAATPIHRHHVRRTILPAGIGVAVDQAKMVALARPAKMLFVGNPTIADISIIDSRHAFVLGKTFGVTNLIALDAEGRQISNQQITVSNGHDAVTVNVASGQFNYSCSRAHCESMPRPGDVATYVTNTEQAVTAHEDAGLKSASGAATGQPGQE